MPIQPGKTMARRKRSEHYVNNKEFLAALITYREDIEITYAGCDTTQRRPDTDNDWRIQPNVNPELFAPDQNDLQWQQQKGEEL